MNEQARRSTPAESSSFTYGPTFRLQLLSTSLRADAVTFGYGAVAYSDTDFHRANVAPSQAHSFRSCFQSSDPEPRLAVAIAVIKHVSQTSVVEHERIFDHLRIPPIGGHINPRLFKF